MCMTKYLDFVHSPFEPVHLNNFSLISSYTKASRPHGLLPAKQKVGESCGLQGAVAYGAAAGEMPLHIHHRIGPARPPLSLPLCGGAALGLPWKARDPGERLKVLL